MPEGGGPTTYLSLHQMTINSKGKVFSTTERQVRVSFSISPLSLKRNVRVRYITTPIGQEAMWGYLDNGETLI